jgi:hypothetical protein
MRFTLISLAMASAAVMAHGAALGFNACPNVGANTTGCALLITVSTVNSFGVGTAFFVTAGSPPSGSIGPYDGSDDTLIGIQNDTLTTLLSITLVGTLGSDIAGFEGDGACNGTWTPGPTAAQCGGFHTSPAGADYQSLGVTFTSFSGISTIGTHDNVTVNFSPGLSPVTSGSCGAAWFSLENDLKPGSFNGGTPGTTCNSTPPQGPFPSRILRCYSVSDWRGLGLRF